MTTISEWLRKIADASRRADGSDIQLGQEVREAADVIDELVKALEITRDRLNSLNHDQFDGVWCKADFAADTEEADAALLRARKE